MRDGLGGLRIMRPYSRVNQGTISRIGGSDLPGRQSEDKGAESGSPDKNESESLLGRMSNL